MADLSAPRESGVNRVGGTQTDRIWLSIVAVGVALLCAPFIGAIGWFGDEGVLLQGADRLLRGERLYVDFFEFLPPGGFVLTAGWLALTDGSFFAVRMLVLANIVAIGCLTYLSCRRVSDSPAMCAAAVLAWALMSQGMWTQLSHHWLTSLFCMILVWAALAWLTSSTRNSLLPILAGFAGGCAVMVTQSRGALILLAGLVAFCEVRRHLSAVAGYCVAALIVPAALIAYLAWQGALEAALESVILYPARHYAGMQSVPYGAFGDAQNRPIPLIFPLAFALSIIFMTKNGKCALRDRLLQSCVAFAVAGALGFAVRPATTQISFAVPLVLPLILLCLNKLITRSFRYMRISMISASVILIAPAVVVYVILTQWVYAQPPIETPRGTARLWYIEKDAHRIFDLIADIPAESRIFMYPWSPLLSFLAKKTPPARTDIFIPGFTTPELYREGCISALNKSE